MRGIPGTYQPRQPQQQNPMMGFSRENQEKGDIRALWRLLGIDFSNGGESDEFNPMAGPQPSRGTEKVVWQRYNPFPKYGDLPPELVFIDHGCGAKEPFCESDPISSKLQNLFFPGPGFIEDTPEVVKRVIAKWHNAQYARQLNQEMRTTGQQFRDGQGPGRRGSRSTNWPAAGRRSRRNSTGSPAAATARRPSGPTRSATKMTLKSLIKDLVGPGDTIGRRRSAPRPVEPLPHPRLRGGDFRRRGRPPGRRRAGTLCDGGGEAEDEAAKLKNSRGQQAARGKEETAKLAETIAALKEGLSRAATVADAVKYAEGVLALQIKDRSFVPLVQTGSEAAGTVPVGQHL